MKPTTKFCILIFLFDNISQIAVAWLCTLILILGKDVEVNSGPKRRDKDSLLIYNQNLNSISTYGYCKLFLLDSYKSFCKRYIICFSQTYLDLIDDEISCYTLVSFYHPSNTKRGGVCLYYENGLSLIFPL